MYEVMSMVRFIWTTDTSGLPQYIRHKIVTCRGSVREIRLYWVFSVPGQPTKLD